MEAAQSAAKPVLYIVMVAVTAYIEYGIPYYPRFFREQDPDLSYPKVPATFTSNEVIGICFVFTAVLLFSVHRAGILGQRLLLPTLLMTFMNGMLLQAFCVNVLKLMFSRMRPNFFADCNYQGFADVVDWKAPSEALTAYMNRTTWGLEGDLSRCLQENAKGHHSFPSGAAAWAFGGMGFLSMVLVAAAKRKDLPGSMQMLAFLPPLILAGYISATRVLEFRHREEDVAVAAIIGFAASYWAFLSLPPLDGKEEEELRAGSGGLSVELA